MTYFFFGAPAAGKGTQAQLLSKALSLPFISIGARLRNLCTTTRLDLCHIMNRGGLLPHEFVEGMLAEIFNQYPDNVVIDGACRTAEQIDSISQLWQKENTLIINLTVSDDTIRRRAERRLHDSSEQRADDAAEVVENRIRVFRKTAEEILEQAKSHGLTVLTINGEQTIEVIHQEILQEIEKLGQPAHNSTTPHEMFSN